MDRTLAQTTWLFLLLTALSVMVAVRLAPSGSAEVSPVAGGSSSGSLPDRAAEFGAGSPGAMEHAPSNRSRKALPPEAVLWVENTLENLDLRGRVAQLVFPWIRGGTIPRNSAEFQRIRRWIESDRVGGLIVSRGDRNEYAPMMNALQSYAGIPLLIISDLETGPSMRLTGGTTVPPAMALGAAADESLAFEAGRLTSIEAKSAGIHATLGPVLDVNSNPLNPIINIRSFGEDPEEVARIGGAWIAGARSDGLLTIAKHFPGHGATEVDSHIGLPTLTASADELERIDLLPFRRAIDTGLDGVLVGHIAVPAIDGPDAPPASLSPGVITGILREKIGFDGLVITDAMNMGGITENYSVPEASILALQAGADALLQPPGEREVINAIVRAVESGRLSPERIEEAARRVLTAKARAGLHEGPAVRASGGAPPASHGEIASSIATASVTLVRDDARLIPLPPAARRILHVTYSGTGSRYTAPAFNAVLESAGARVEVVSTNASTAASTYASLRNRADSFDLVIASSNLVPREYRGQLVVQDRFSTFVEGLVDNGVPVVAVSFGSPYVLEYFPSVRSYLVAWSSSAMTQRAAARALIGEAPIRGRLPVSLPPFHPIGTGVSR